MSRIVEFYNLKSALELGTSLGLGSAYLSSTGAELTTLEGCPQIAQKAKENFEKLGLTNINLKIGEFENSFSDLADTKYDLVYIDGNHQEEATLKYFEKFLDHAHNDTFLVFDDIRWSEGMERAWKKIIQSEKIHVSIELLRMGIVLKRKEQVKQHFILKF